MAPWPGLATPRARLRPLGPADAPAFHALVTRADTGPMLFLFPPDWTPAAAADFLRGCAWTGRPGFRLGIEAGGDLAGWIGCSDDAEPQVFYALTPAHRGHGLAAEVLAAFCTFLFDRFDPPALRAGVFDDNPASLRVLTRCGFSDIGGAMLTSAARAAPAPGRWMRRPNPARVPDDP